jgi:hypothetical protein
MKASFSLDLPTIDRPLQKHLDELKWFTKITQAMRRMGANNMNSRREMPEPRQCHSPV